MTNHKDSAQVIAELTAALEAVSGAYKVDISTHMAVRSAMEKAQSVLARRNDLPKYKTIAAPRALSEKIRDCRERAMTVAEISEELGIGKNLVLSTCRRLKIPAVKPTKIHDGSEHFLPDEWVKQCTIASNKLVRAIKKFHPERYTELKPRTNTDY